MAASKPQRQRAPWRLRSHRDYRKLACEGQRAQLAPWLFVQYQAGPRWRVGWTLPRVVGNAVVRNRLKRWLREYFKELALLYRESRHYELNLVFRRQRAGFYRDITHEEFRRALDRGIARLENRLTTRPTSIRPVGDVGMSCTH